MIQRLPRGLGRAPALLLAAGGVLLSGGCYTAQLEKLQADLDAANQTARRIETNAETLAARLTSLEQQLSAEQGEARAQRADQAARHRELLEELATLEALLTDSQEHRNLLSERWQSAPWAGPQAAAPVDSAAAADSAGLAVAPALSSPALTQEIRLAYEAARLDLTRGDYPLAAEGFRDFVRLYPETELSDNAQYWLGECLYAEGKYEESLAEFALVTTRYPRGEKVPAALLKMGFSLAELGRAEEAISVLKRVAAEHPRTQEADRALERIKSLGAGN